MSTLHFPALCVVDQNFRPDNDGNRRYLARLDWSGKAVPEAGQELPTQWRDWMDQQVFAVTSDYEVEIVRCREMGRAERNMYRTFDTVVRDFCLKPSQAYFETAFRLIADCHVDPKTGKGRPCEEDGGSRTYLLPQLMLYRFWQFQTGRGLPWYFSGFDRLEERVNERPHPFSCAAQMSLERKLVEEMRAHDEWIVHRLGTENKSKDFAAPDSVVGWANGVKKA